MPATGTAMEVATGVVRAVAGASSLSTTSCFLTQSTLPILFVATGLQIVFVGEPGVLSWMVVVGAVVLRCSAPHQAHSLSPNDQPQSHVHL